MFHTGDRTVQQQHRAAVLQRNGARWHLWIRGRGSLVQGNKGSASHSPAMRRCVRACDVVSSILDTSLHATFSMCGRIISWGRPRTQAEVEMSHTALSSFSFPCFRSSALKVKTDRLALVIRLPVCMHSAYYCCTDCCSFY